MADLIGYARVLAEEIGPRPVNSEQEQQSAQAIKGWLDEAGLDARIEEFNCTTWATWPYAVSFIGMMVAALLSYFHGGAGVVMFIFAIVFLGVFVFERYLHGHLADRFKRGISQNVVAKYVPYHAQRTDRRRKIIIVAHYDSTRNAFETSPSLVNGYPLLQKANLVCMIAVPVLMIIQMVPAFEIIMKWMWLLSVFASILPFAAGVCILLQQFVLPYNDGANNNASGVAAMMGTVLNIVPGAANAALDRATSRRRIRRETPREESEERALGAFAEKREEEAAETESRGREESSEVIGGTARDERDRRKSPFAGAIAALSAKAEDLKEGFARDHDRRSEREDDRASRDVRQARPSEDEGVFEPGAAQVQKEMTPFQMSLGETQPYSPVSGDESDVREEAEPSRTVEELEISSEMEPVAQAEGEGQATTGDGGVYEGENAYRTPPDDSEGSARNEGMVMPPLRNSGIGTTDARPRARKRPAWETNPALQEPVSTTPSWWKKAEENRKAVQDDEEREQILKARSRFASVPTAEERHAQAEALAAERRRAKKEKEAAEEAKRREQAQAYEAEQQSKSQGDDARRAVSPVPQPSSDASAGEETGQGLAPEAAKAASQSEGDATSAASGEATGIEHVEQKIERQDRAIDEIPVQTQPAAVAAVAEPLWMRDSSSADKVNALSQDSDAIAGLPSLDDTGAHLRNAPSLIMDENFGASQPAPLSEGYSNTEQRGSTGDFEAISRLPKSEESSDSEQENPDNTGSGIFATGTFAPGQTGAFVPIGDSEALKAVDIEADTIEDADDSQIANTPMVGDFSAPASIEIPESRARKAFSRLFGKKKSDDETSASEWLGVDKDYNPRKAGKDIGSWDNFDDDDGWDGGAVDYPGGSNETEEVAAADEVVQAARSGMLDKEVWFVALGASGAGNAGMKEFINKHAASLRGSVVINLDCVGAGEICVVDQEGVGRSVQSDYRLRTLVGRLIPELDGNVEIESLTWTDTDASIALRAGLRAITLMGFKESGPVAYRHSSDTTSVLEESRLSLVAELTSELIYNT